MPMRRELDLRPETYGLHPDSVIGSPVVHGNTLTFTAWSMHSNGQRRVARRGDSQIEGFEVHEVLHYAQLRPGRFT